MKLQSWFSLLAVLCLSLGSGCSTARTLVAMSRSTDNFVPLESDARVRYAPGAELLANNVALHLDASIEAVRKAQYRDFAKPVTIFVCATVEQFGSFCTSEKAAGCVIDERLFISPKPENTPERIPRIVTHELSHLQVVFQLGSGRWTSGLPVWFQEGLAVFVSQGGGAEGATPEEARAFIKQGRTFRPDTEGGIFFRKCAQTYGLEKHMFYRQSGLFVEYLFHSNEAAFKQFLLGIEDGARFDEAFLSAYGRSVAAVWDDFVKS